MRRLHKHPSVAFVGSSFCVCVCVCVSLSGSTILAVMHPKHRKIPLKKRDARKDPDEDVKVTRLLHRNEMCPGEEGNGGDLVLTRVWLQSIAFCLAVYNTKLR